MEATWQHFNNPLRFYRRMLRIQVELGLVDKKMMKISMIHRENPFCWMLKRPLFWIELLIMLLIPLPMKDEFFQFAVIEIPVINWVDNT